MNTSASTETWKNVRELIVADGGHDITLGTITHFILQNNPTHLLFILSRYKNAARLLPKNCSSVLELGCSEGLGSLILNQYAQNVTSVDSDSVAITYAKQLPSKITFIEDDFLGKRYGTFRAAVSLDVIEHIPVAEEPSFMETITQNLTHNGVCVIGTPNVTAAAYASEASKIAHVNLYDADRLHALMAKYFHNVLLFGMNDEVLHTGFSPMAHYLMVAGFGKK